MSHIFISYSRKDLAFAQSIVDALAVSKLDTWIDWKSIPKGEDWEQEIYRGIEEANAFLYLLSPDSVASEMCNKEIAHAVKNNKRVIPIVIRDADVKNFRIRTSRNEISRRNWIFCRSKQDDFSKAMAETRKTIRTDYEWLKYHTELQVKALKWEQKKDASRLLRGKELREGEDKFANLDSTKEPIPTDLQRKYLQISRKNENRVRRLQIASLTIAVLAILGFATWFFLIRERPIPAKWVSIPAGSFIMGMDQDEANYANALCVKSSFDSSECMLPDELITWSGRQTDATLDEYAVLDNEVTNAQYQQCVDAGGCKASRDWSYEPVNINLPATRLDWFQANEYCKWLGGRLPTEAEWEKAARGPDGRYFPWGNDWDFSMSNLERYGINPVQNIAMYVESDKSFYGIKNMAGNVQEWTVSKLVSINSNQPFNNDVFEWEDIGENRLVIVRGGAWVNARSVGMGSNREVDGILSQREEIGFRCVCPNEMSCMAPWTWLWTWIGR